MLAGGAGGNIDEFDNQLNDPNQYDNPQDPASLSVTEHLRALSIRGKLTLVYIAGVLIYLLVQCDWVRQLYTRYSVIIASHIAVLGQLQYQYLLLSRQPRAKYVRAFGLVRARATYFIRLYT